MPRIRWQDTREKELGTEGGNRSSGKGQATGRRDRENRIKGGGTEKGKRKEIKDNVEGYWKRIKRKPRP